MNCTLYYNDQPDKKNCVTKKKKKNGLKMSNIINQRKCIIKYKSLFHK